jgi:hypothetical protein
VLPDKSGVPAGGCFSLGGGVKMRPSEDTRIDRWISEVGHGIFVFAIDATVS